MEIEGMAQKFVLKLNQNTPQKPGCARDHSATVFRLRKAKYPKKPGCARDHSATVARWRGRQRTGGVCPPLNSSSYSRFRLRSSLGVGIVC